MTNPFKIKLSIVLLFVLIAISLIGLDSRANDRTLKFKDTSREYNAYHVSVDGNDANFGTKTSSLRTISAAANLAMTGETVPVHAGI